MKKAFSDLEKAIHHCLRGEQGALVREHLSAAVMSLSFCADSHETAFKEGQRAMALRLLTAFRRVEGGEDTNNE